jgi:transcriptional regulator with XRE-family HTH domain
MKRTRNSSSLSPCQIVAWNLGRARRARGWSQEETARRLEPCLGYRLSRAALSQAERSIEGKRIRRFDADEIVAFARVFELPVSYFFIPPASPFRGRPVEVNGKPSDPRASVTSEPLTYDEMLNLAIHPAPEVRATLRMAGLWGLSQAEADRIEDRAMGMFKETLRERAEASRRRRKS